MGQHDDADISGKNKNDWRTYARLAGHHKIRVGHELRRLRCARLVGLIEVVIRQMILLPNEHARFKNGPKQTLESALGFVEMEGGSLVVQGLDGIGLAPGDFPQCVTICVNATRRQVYEISRWWWCHNYGGRQSVS
jgi:hypothetical protein